MHRNPFPNIQAATALPAKALSGAQSGRTYSLEQAAEAAPGLAALYERVRESQRLLALIRQQLPEALRQQVRSGPLSEEEWCLLVDSASVSSKLRQLLPNLLSTLNQNGAKVSAIRIKVQHRVR